MELKAGSPSVVKTLCAQGSDATQRRIIGAPAQASVGLRVVAATASRAAPFVRARRDAARLCSRSQPKIGLLVLDFPVSVTPTARISRRLREPHGGRPPAQAHATPPPSSRPPCKRSPNEQHRPRFTVTGG